MRGDGCGEEEGVVVWDLAKQIAIVEVRSQSRGIERLSGKLWFSNSFYPECDKPLR